MGFQKTVTPKLANGVVGEFYDDTVRKVDTYLLDSEDDSKNIVGYAFTVKDEGVVEAGGTGLFAGLLVNPKQYANFNISLGAVNTVKDGTQASISKCGRIWANVGGAGDVGDSVRFDNATGKLEVGGADTGKTVIPNCKIFYYPATANGLAVLELLN